LGVAQLRLNLERTAIFGGSLRGVAGRLESEGEIAD
jgi:hypothetical protein